jgi:DNA-binding NtrC family response regulator
MTSALSVLIVDDDPGSLQLLQAILEDVGLQVTAADGPRAALRQAEAKTPDLLVTDLRMPDMNGLELVRAVRELDPEICCLVITGFASDETTADAYRAGVVDLLLKPINVAEVQSRVRNAAELVRLRREVRALRAEQSAPQPEPRDCPAASRARELADLPALPGSAGPLDVVGWEETLHRLERLGSLRRQGVIGPHEFEEKKRILLARL